MKYIVIESKTKTGCREIPIIFPNALVHSQIADLMIPHMKVEHHAISAKAISAGEISFFEASITCSGHSSSLGLKSRKEEDSSLIKMYDYTHGLKF